MIKRKILFDLKKHLLEPEITVLIGPRQVGKTYLMGLLQNYLERKKEKTVFLSLDNSSHKQFFVSQNTLINYLNLQLGHIKGYIFIDEIQRKENAGLFLKGIYDMKLPFKFIVSGSGSLDLKARIKESMAGRKRLFIVEPVSFEEFVNFNTSYKYENKLGDLFSVDRIKTASLLEEYMQFGGYPKVVLADTFERKQIVIDEIYGSYIERDITDLLGVEKPDAFTDLLKIIASQIGSMVNITELSSTIGISAKTIQNYLWYLEQTFIIKKLTPYYRNIRSEITKAPVYYFYDIGLRNYLLGLFGLPAVPSNLRGHLFENIIFNELRQILEFSAADIHFWRTRDHAEVDFVISAGFEVIPIEVKFAVLKEPKITRSFRNFLAKYKPKKGYVVHLGEEFNEEIKGVKIYFVPYFKLSQLINIKTLP